MVETIFDTLNAKAALYALEEAFDARGARLPVMISGTITDASGRTLSGQTAEAFMRRWRMRGRCRSAELRAGRRGDAPARGNPFAGRRLLRQRASQRRPAQRLRRVRRDAGGDGRTLRGFAEDGLLNLVGGCCGSTPDHIRAIARPWPAAAARPARSQAA
jgi:5-methyltetrahydrofolate--homocysteine methyltransferase